MLREPKVSLGIILNFDPASNAFTESERAIPDGLSFDEVIHNKSKPVSMHALIPILWLMWYQPCSLNDFMDYLVYVEYNAENLQFYLWYREYEHRFNALPGKEKALSKEWIPEEVPGLTKGTDGEKATAKPNPKRNKIRKGKTEDAYDSKGAELFTEDRELAAAEDRHDSRFKENASTLAGSSASDITATPSTAEVIAQADLKWQPCEFIPVDSRGLG